MLLKFGLDIQNQTEARVQKLKNPIWPPGGHFESDISENYQALTHDHKQNAYEIWNWNSKANSSYASETTPPAESRYRWIPYGHQAAILKVTSLKINKPYTQVMCYWSLDLIFKAKLKLESGNRKVQYGCQAAILKVTSSKINRVLPIATKSVHMKFEIEIPKVNLSYAPETMSFTDGRTDGRTRWIQYTPHPLTSLGGGIITNNAMMNRYATCRDHACCHILQIQLNHQLNEWIIVINLPCHFLTRPHVGPDHRPALLGYDVPKRTTTGRYTQRTASRQTYNPDHQASSSAARDVTAGQCCLRGVYAAVLG